MMAVFLFLSTLSLRRATALRQLQSALRHFYPRSPCGERQALGMLGWLRVLISIHALLAESDREQFKYVVQCRNFYPRSPCGERPYTMTTTICTASFLSTLSLRRATRLPTALRTPHHRFLSTLSLRRATLIEFRKLLHPSYFYPRSPCGERLYPIISLLIIPLFLSTLSLRRATLHINRTAETVIFLSTLSLRRATTAFYMDCQKSTYFYPRSPCGERLPAR